MKISSPFPGMDPYLEKFWGDVHTRLITYTSDQLQEQLPRALRARAQERVFVQDASKMDGARVILPDVHVVEGRTRKGRPNGSRASELVADEPLVVNLESEPVTQRYIEIIDVSSGGRVVTVLEFLSPSNKVAGEGLNLYLKKQGECKEAGVHLVEIDLIRQGKRVLLARPELLPASHRTTYQISVWRANRPGAVEAYPVALRGRLPRISVPLRDDDPDVTLDLQAVLERCYQHGRYDDIDYTVPAEPPLDDKDARWLKQLLKGRKRRR